MSEHNTNNYSITQSPLNDSIAPHDWTSEETTTRQVEDLDSGPTTGLLYLPVELLIEVLKLLSWKDLLHMREMCKVLYDSTKARSIWEYLVEEHISLQSVPPRLERPIDMHSSSDLEHLFLLWKGAETAWKTDDDRPARERTFHCQKAQFTHLVKGGRWYLTTAPKTGAVTYYDLDAETISGANLIPPQANFCNDHGLVVALDIDIESPLLEFTMAFSIFDTASDSNTLSGQGPFYIYQAIHIWRVSCILDTFGRATGLSATQIAAIPHRPVLSMIFSLSLRGTHLAFAGLSGAEQKIFIIVMEWLLADAEPLYRLRIIDTTLYNSASVYLLQKGQLLLQAMQTLSLYNYTAIEERTHITSHALPPEPPVIWDCRAIDCSRKAVLEVFSVANATRVIISGARSLFSVTIEDGSREPPTIVQIMQSPGHISEYRLALGFNRGLVLALDTMACQLIKYTLTDRGDSVMSVSSVLRSLSSRLPPVFRHPTMDEDTGRIVISGTFENTETVVVDFSSIKKN